LNPDVMMAPPAWPTMALMSAAVALVAASLAHLACIVWGGPLFRRLGAGEALARMADKGHWYPPVVALVIGGVLAVWAAYAVAGAGWLAPLPFMRWVLPAVAGVFLLRAVAFPLLKPAFPENSDLFWWVSSGICLVIGGLVAAGTAGVWHRL